MRRMKIILIVVLMLNCFISFNWAKSQSEIIDQVKNDIKYVKERINQNVDDNLKDRAESIKDGIDLIEDYETKKEYSKEVNYLINKIQDMLDGDDVKKIIKDVRFVMEDGDITLKLPTISDEYQYNVLVKDADYDFKMISGVYDKGGSYDLPEIKERTKIYYKVSIKNKNTGRISTTERTTSVYDNSSPKITAIYMLDEKLHVEVEDNYKLADRYIKFIIDDDDDGYDDEDDIEIDDFPTKVGIKVRDLFGNESYTKTVNITEDNKVYYGSISRSAQKKLDREKESDYKEDKYIENMVICEYGKELHYIEAFDDVFKEVFGRRYDDDDVEVVTSELKYNEKTQKLLLNKKGVFKVTFMEDDDEDDIATVYVVVGDEKGKIDSNIQYIQNCMPFIFTKSRIRFSDYINIIPDRYSDKNDINKDYVVIIKDGMVYDIDSYITMTENKVYNFEIYNIGQDKISHMFKYIKVSGHDIKFKDTYKHWAYSQINSMVRKGVISGYNDNTFRPDNYITVREFLVMLSKVDPMKKRLNKGDLTVYSSEYDWAFCEINNIFSKISYIDVSKSGLNYKLDKFISREEVAFLIAKYNDMVNKGNNKSFKDIYNSKFKEQIDIAVSNGYIKGYKDGTFRPYNGITRAEAVTLLYRIGR